VPTFDHAIKYDPTTPKLTSTRRAFFIIGKREVRDRRLRQEHRNGRSQPLVFAERGYARQTQGQNSEARRISSGLKLNNDLRLMLDLHLLDLQMQIKEMERRQSVIKKNIA
jgi:hypothetical protein